MDLYDIVNTQIKIKLKLSPFQVFCEYLALKSHFSNTKYDYFKYNKKVRATIASFNRRRDRYFFEKASRKYSDKEIVNFFVSNFVSANNIEKVWVGEIIRNGETVYTEWLKKIQSLFYMFKTEVEIFIQKETFKELFFCKRGKHPKILKKYLEGTISLETMVILDIIFNYSSIFDKRLDDPVWETVSLKISKYKPFLNIDVAKYKKVLQEILL